MDLVIALAGLMGFRVKPCCVHITVTVEAVASKEVASAPLDSLEVGVSSKRVHWEQTTRCVEGSSTEFATALLESAVAIRSSMDCRVRNASAQAIAQAMETVMVKQEFVSVWKVGVEWIALFSNVPTIAHSEESVCWASASATRALEASIARTSNVHLGVTQYTRI